VKESQPSNFLLPGRAAVSENLWEKMIEKRDREEYVRGNKQKWWWGFFKIYRKIALGSPY